MTQETRINRTSNGAFISFGTGTQISAQMDQGTAMYSLTVSKRSYYAGECLNDKVYKHLSPPELEEIVKTHLTRYGVEDDDKVLAEFKSALKPMGNDWFRI